MISMSFFRMLTLSGTACLVALALAVSEAREAPLAPGPLTAAEAAAEDHAKGKEVYAANKCQMCHMIDGAGNKRAPLDGVGSRLSKDDIRKWILTPAQMNPKVKKPNFAKIAAADLTALVDYLASLK